MLSGSISEDLGLLGSAPTPHARRPRLCLTSALSVAALAPERPTWSAEAVRCVPGSGAMHPCGSPATKSHRATWASPSRFIRWAHKGHENIVLPSDPWKTGAFPQPAPSRPSSYRSSFPQVELHPVLRSQDWASDFNGTFNWTGLAASSRPVLKPMD